MKQQSLNFTDVEYMHRKKVTKREEFLASMDKMIPWDDWVNIIAPYYPSGKRGRPVRGIEPCSVCTLCRTGLTSLMLLSKIQSMTAMP